MGKRKIISAPIRFGVCCAQRTKGCTQGKAGEVYHQRGFSVIQGFQRESYLRILPRMGERYVCQLIWSGDLGRAYEELITLDRVKC